MHAPSLARRFTRKEFICMFESDSGGPQAFALKAIRENLSDCDHQHAVVAEKGLSLVQADIIAYVTNAHESGVSEAFGFPLHLRPSLAASEEPKRGESIEGGGEVP